MVVSVDRVRARMLDGLAADALPGAIDQMVSGWRCKASPDLPFRRANCVLPTADAGDDLRRAKKVVAEIERGYRELGRRVLVQVSSADAQVEALDTLLAARDYVVEAPVDVLVAPRERVAFAAAGALPELESSVGRGVAVAVASRPAGFRADPGATAPWLELVDGVHGDDDGWRARTAAYGRVMESVPAAAHLGSVSLGRFEETIGIGFGVVAEGWLGVFGMGTAIAWRRRGVAACLLGAFAEEAAIEAEQMYLQVEVDNVPAQALYASLGFVRSHGYHYRVKDVS